MTISEAIEAARDLTGAVVSDATMVRWLSELDGKLMAEVFRGNSWTTYDAEEDADCELLVPHPWDGMYVHYLEGMTYYSNAEYDRYTNSTAMYNAVLTEFRAYLRRQAPDKIVAASGGNHGNWYYLDAYGIAVKHGFEGTVEEWLASLCGTYTSDAGCCVEFGELTGNGTLYFSMAYESRPYYHLHTTDPDTGAVVSDSDATVEWVMYGNYYIGITLSGLEEDATTLIVCYCSLPAEVDEEATDHEHSYSVSFTWAEDYSSCTATFVCSDCGNTQTISCTVTSQTTAATEDEDGETVYTATCTLSGTEYTDSQSVTIPATGDGWTLTHEWDLTSSAVDTVTDGEATLTGCVITEDGLYFSAAAQNCYLGSIWGTNHAIEIDCGEMSPQSSTSTHMRTFMIYTSGLNMTEGLVWRYQTGAWDFYHDGAWEGSLSMTDRDYFSGTTVRIESDSDGYLSLYVDGELVGESTGAFAGQTEVSLGSYGASYYNAYYTAVRVYEKGSA